MYPRRAIFFCSFISKQGIHTFFKHFKKLAMKFGVKAFCNICFHWNVAGKEYGQALGRRKLVSPLLGVISSFVTKVHLKNV